MGIQSSAFNSIFGPRQKSSGRLILLFQASFETLIFKQFSSGVGIITWGVRNMTWSTMIEVFYWLFVCGVYYAVWGSWSHDLLHRWDVKGGWLDPGVLPCPVLSVLQGTGTGSSSLVNTTPPLIQSGNWNEIFLDFLWKFLLRSLVYINQATRTFLMQLWRLYLWRLKSDKCFISFKSILDFFHDIVSIKNDFFVHLWETFVFWPDPRIFSRIRSVKKLKVK